MCRQVCKSSAVGFSKTGLSKALGGRQRAGKGQRRCDERTTPRAALPMQFCTIRLVATLPRTAVLRAVRGRVPNAETCGADLGARARARGGALIRHEERAGGKKQSAIWLSDGFNQGMDSSNLRFQKIGHTKECS